MQQGPPPSGGPQAPRPRPDGQPPAPGGAPRPAITIPSYSEVRQAERAPAATTNLFRPGAIPAAPPQPSAAPYRPPPAFAQGPGAGLLQPQYGGARPSFQQQQQQQPWRPPPQAPGSGGTMQHAAAMGPPPPQQQYPYQYHNNNQQQPAYAPPSFQQPRPYAAPPPPHPQAPRPAAAPAAAPPPLNPADLPPVNPAFITVSPRQRGNPLLKHIRHVRWQYGDIVPDYQLGGTTAALFLSLRYHLLKPEYVHGRMKELKGGGNGGGGGSLYRLKVLLVHVDTEDAATPLAQVTRAALGNDFTLLCGFSTAECARYLETLKSYENKPAAAIQKDLGSDYASRAAAALTSVRGVNKTDVKTLGDRFGSMAAVMQAGEAELKACPGVGPVKAKRLYEAFHEPFRRTLAAPAAAAAADAQQQQIEQQTQMQPVLEQVLAAEAEEGEDEEGDSDFA